MRLIIAGACSIKDDCVSIKATTEEGLGFTGRGLGISSHAACLIEKK
jgi:2-C-methyl-D-erythritol 2,4-cyclodiphosphate synthase